ncbi:hypothetical protein BDQ17DRAFT_1334268 [Cyathus striatus]|nr:hypothetical protein BDQ17DRAFT_1334268 [Cyathus striatus]
MLPRREGWCTREVYLLGGKVLRCPRNLGQVVVQEQGYILVEPPIFKLVTVTAWSGKTYSCAPTNATGGKPRRSSCKATMLELEGCLKYDKGVTGMASWWLKSRKKLDDLEY